LRILVPSNASRRAVESVLAPNGECLGISDGTPDESAINCGASQNAASAPDANRVDWLQFLPRYHPYVTDYHAYVDNDKLDPNTDVAALIANRTVISQAVTISTTPTNAKPLFKRSNSNEKLREYLENRRHHNSMHKSPTRDVVPQRKSILVEPPTNRQGNSGHGLGSHRKASKATCRLMFDPVSEVPMLTEWFENNSQPTCYDIEKFTDLLNSKSYRRRYPLVSAHNVKIWFKNRRAKCKRV